MILSLLRIPFGEIRYSRRYLSILIVIKYSAGITNFFKLFVGIEVHIHWNANCKPILRNFHLLYLYTDGLVLNFRELFLISGNEINLGSTEYVGFNLQRVSVISKGKVSFSVIGSFMFPKWVFWVQFLQRVIHGQSQTGDEG